MEFTHVTNPNFPPPQQPIKYENNFQYERWSEYETELTLCNVPWGTSEIMVGQRVYGGNGRVVYFGDDATRDNYFNNLPNKMSFKVLYRGFSQEEFKIILPYDMAINYNYLYVEYSPATAADSLLAYEGVNGIRRIYYFIRDIEYIAPNTTRVTVLLDYWTTFINSITVTSLGVERGHIAQQITPAEFLENPLDNSDLVTAADIEPLETEKSGNSRYRLFNNGAQYAVIASTANLSETAGSDNWIVCSPLEAVNTISLYTFALPIENLYDFMEWLNSDLPHYVATIQGVWIVPAQFIAGGTFTVGGFTLTLVTQPDPELFDLSFTPEDFPQYYSVYRGLTKLYTSPYSYLEINDFRGNTTTVKIQDLSDNVKLETALAVAAPFVGLSSNLLGVGGNEITELTFNNAHSFKYYSSGIEHELEWNYEIPVYAVTQQPSIDYDIHSVYERAQNQTQWENDYSSAAAAANAISANANAAAGTQTQIAGYQTSFNSDKTDGANLFSFSQEQANEQKLSQDGLADYQYSEYATQANVDSMASSAWVNAANGLVSGGMSGAITGAVGGAPGAAIGAMGGAIIGAASTGAAASIAISKEAALNSLAMQNNQAHTNNAVNMISAVYTAQITYNNILKNLENVFTTESAAANAALTSTQGANNYNAAITAASNNRNTAQNATANTRKQARLNEPRQFGRFAGDGIRQNLKPLGLCFTIKGLADGELRRIGDEFTRYGYYVNQWFDFTTFNIGKEFTYWKCFDFLITSSLPDAFTDRIKVLLRDGITVYRNPEYLSHSIYENL